MPPNGSQVRASYIWIMIAFTSAILLGTLLAATGKGENLRFVFLADSRNDANFINIAALHDINSRIVTLVPKPAFVIFGGDMATYGLKADGSDNFKAFKKAMETVTKAGIKLYVVLGNHELYQESIGGTQMFRANQMKYQQGFADMPDNGPNDDYKRLVYSFTSPGGDSFFAVLDPFYMDSNTPVVDIIGKQVKVTTFGGINGNYSPVDRSFIPPIASPIINDLLSLRNVP